jgi:DNA-binding LacI/PurR family transcriptional regulator
VITPETRQLLGPSVPVTSVAISDKSGSPSVAIDDEQAAYDATRHLLRLGHAASACWQAIRRRSMWPSPASAATPAP